MKKLLVLTFVLSFIPATAKADPLEPVFVAWDGTGAENLPCPNGGHWHFDQGVVEGYGIYNATIQTDEYMFWGMGFDWMQIPHDFTANTLYPITSETVINYGYTSEETPEFQADDHLVLESCLPPPVPLLKVFHFQVTVTTPVPGKAQVFWRSTCTVGGVPTVLSGQYKTPTPDTRSIPVPLTYADDCTAIASAKFLNHPRSKATVVVTGDSV